MTTVICEHDGVKFKAARADAKFCSDRCRRAAARAAGADPDTGEIKSPPAKNPLSSKFTPIHSNV